MCWKRDPDARPVSTHIHSQVYISFSFIIWCILLFGWLIDFWQTKRYWDDCFDEQENCCFYFTLILNFHFIFWQTIEYICQILSSPWNLIQRKWIFIVFTHSPIILLSLQNHHKKTSVPIIAKKRDCSHQLLVLNTICWWLFDCFLWDWLPQ
jgi:hypothetical protein